jgi:hypothetical protein
MKTLKEITVWPDNTPNHSYRVNDGGKLVAYRKTGTKDWITFARPLQFVTTHRKFIKLKNDD